MKKPKWVQTPSSLECGDEFRIFIMSLNCKFGVYCYKQNEGESVEQRGAQESQ